MSEKDVEKYKKKLAEKEKEITKEVDKLKFMLDNMDIEDINLLNFHYRFNKLTNERDYLKKIIFNHEY